jgi:Xaa-Pro dipeptidase
MPDAPDLNAIQIPACRGRQQRLLAEMHKLQLDMVIVSRIEHVQWLVGPRYPATFSPYAALMADGRVTLIAPNTPPPVAAADEVRCYQAQRLCTLRNDQGVAAAAILHEVLAGGKGPLRVGVEFSVCGPAVCGSLSSEFVDIEPTIYRLRRHKDPDELSRIKKAIAGTAAMHARAREIIAPGVNELHVFNELQAAAVRAYGEMMTGTGNDYACGVAGGPPRDRKIEAGELYILDLGPAYRGYYADNTRVYAVDGRPTEAQLRAWEHILPVFELVERTVKPGKSCPELFYEAQALLDRAKPYVFDHHLGHGIGLFPHEAPHLNPEWNDTFEVGEVFAVEPGLYAPELRAGIRLENNYLVTEHGVELLTDFPLVLV